MDDPVGAARALLLQFQRSPLKALHLAQDGFELFLSRDPTITGPRSGAPAPPPVLAAATHFATAPHVATLVAIEPPGAVVAPGGAVAQLRLLDETITLVAEAGGTIVEHAAAPGALVEFGQPVAGLAA